MSSTRRSFVRDAGLLSLAASLPLRSLAEDVCQPVPNPTGIRLFFGGAWLFIPDPHFDPKTPTLLAVTLDPTKASSTADQDLPHLFQYGVWKEPTTTSPWTGNPFPASTARTPSPVTITEPINPAPPDPPATLQALFEATAVISPFTWVQAKLSSTASAPAAVYSDPGVYAIRVPMPWALVPTAYRTDATVVDTSQTILQGRPSGAGPLNPATTHVLLYPYATSVGFNGEPAVSTSTATPYIDYHFHAIPNAKEVDPVSHPTRMFARLFGLTGVDTTSLVLNATTCQTLAPCPPCNLKGVTAAELGYELSSVHTDAKTPKTMKEMTHMKMAPSDCPRTIKLTTCCSGGGGANCPPTGC